VESMRVGVVGGTGPQAKGLAYRFARAGHTVVMSCRDSDRAVVTATEMSQRLAGLPGAGSVDGNSNEAARPLLIVKALTLATCYAADHDGHSTMRNSEEPRSSVQPVGRLPPDDQGAASTVDQLFNLRRDVP
jgi:NAD(P)-dependent dehydrogenase (short-subunit alcohol dehydrogenase family)